LYCGSYRIDGAMGFYQNLPSTFMIILECVDRIPLNLQPV